MQVSRIVCKYIVLSTNPAAFIPLSTESATFVLMQICHCLYKKCSSHFCLEFMFYRQTDNLTVYWLSAG